MKCTVCFGNYNCRFAVVHFYFINTWEKKKNFFTLQKIIILFENYQMLHVKQPDIVSGVRLETKPQSVHEIDGHLHNHLFLEVLNLT